MTDGDSIGVDCCVAGCDGQIVGLEDGREAHNRDGVACASCWEFFDRHAHWPDEDPTACVECMIDDGAVRHQCDEMADGINAVILEPEADCEYCGETVHKPVPDGGVNQPTSSEELPELVRIRCPECETETTVKSETAREKLHTHDEKRHDGERTAGLKVRTDDGFVVLPHPDDVATDGGVVETESRLSWPRRYENGNPIVGYHCANCDFEIEHVYQPSLLHKCPSCGGNPQGVRRFEVEEIVEERRERLQEQLADHYGHPMSRSPECSVCGTDEDVHLDPGENLQNFEYRCPEHHLLGYSFWWQPGDHPGLLTRDWIETCDECGAEFTSVFGISFRDHRSGYTRDKCLRCADINRLRRVIDDNFALNGGDQA